MAAKDQTVVVLDVDSRRSPKVFGRRRAAQTGLAFVAALAVFRQGEEKASATPGCCNLYYGYSNCAGCGTYGLYYCPNGSSPKVWYCLNGCVWQGCGECTSTSDNSYLACYYGDFYCSCSFFAGYC